MIFEADGLRLQIGDAALCRLRELAQTGPDDPERAGFLLGRMARRSLVEIVALTEPGPRCRSTRFGCHLDGEHHAAEIRRAWDESGGEVFAAGHWHTHPEPAPRPSRIDLESWQSQLHGELGGASHFAFLIVGTAEIRAWIGTVGTSEIERMPDATRSAA